MNRKYNLKLDLQFRCNNSTMKFDEFDNNTSDFFIRVTRAGELIDISKAIVTLVVIKPDNSVDAQFVDIDSNRAYCDLKPTMKNLVGKYEAIASITVDGETVNTGIDNPIIYEVTENKFLRQLNQKVVTEERFTLLTDMINRLSTIEISEEQRVINEAERILSEENRKIEEAKRVEAELIRQHEEADRAKYDATRESNENIRKQNERIRLANETNRIDEETKRVEEENKRKLAEEERNANYNFMTEDEERRRLEANAHKEAEVLRVQAETNRVNEEAKRRTTEQARVSAENTRVNNENTRKANETTRQTNETHRVEAETQRQNRYNSFIVDAEANANNFENYTNNAKIKEEERKSNELNRKSQEDRRVSNEVERISNENTRKANEVVREKNEASRQNTFTNKVNEVDKKIIEINTTKDNFVSSVNTKVDSKISELDSAKSDMTNTVANKVNEVENRFNALTSKQQQDAEVIDARDGETSLKARLDRDIEKAKQVYVNIEGSNISTDSSVGYLKDVEILGNTIQSASNLADIRSVGDKIEGQELYEIPVVSCGKNLFDGNEFTPREAINQYSYIDGILTMRCDGQAYRRVDYILPNTLVHGKRYILTANVKALEYSSGYTPSQNFGYGYYNGGSSDYYGSFDASSNTAKLEFVYNEQGENVIGFHNEVKEGLTKLQWSNIQLEEGTVATPYEPYIEDKLTILSPVQLERVGDVADRIIEKDGVWGVEKSIKTYTFNENPSTYGLIYNDTWKQDGNTRAFYTYYLKNVSEDKIAEGTYRAICDKLPFTKSNIATSDIVSIGTNVQFVGFRVPATELESYDVEGCNKWISKNTPTVKYVRLKPQFIPLPHSQQIKLRTFASKTNISFLTEIEGTIKAQVPKSIGATVNTHTEQISNLNKELDRVKKLEESTVSTVTTESDFTTVEATTRGYFDDVKLEGKTLVNLLTRKINCVLTSTNRVQASSLIKNLSFDKEYTLFINGVTTSKYGAYISIKYADDAEQVLINANINNNVCVKFKLSESKEVLKLNIAGWSSNSTDSNWNINYAILLEGDHTQNPPSYFEGLKSVGDGTDEIVVSSVNSDNTKSDKKRLLYCNEETQTWEKPILREWDSIEKHSDGKYYYHQRSGGLVFDGSEDEGWWDTTSYGSERENTLEFRGNADNILRSVDVSNFICDKFNFVANIWIKDVEGICCIENNRIDIRIPKTKLSTQDVAGFKQWLQTNNVTVVYQLAQEKVYECTNIDLITYANETNFIIESGVLSPKTTLKVHSNISNVVSLLQKKVSLLESNMTKYMITQNRLMLASRYNADTVSFKVDVASFSDTFEYDNDLYELILNNILVGKDNYNREYIENLIRFYWMDFVISDEMYSTLFEIIEEQHNPKIEEETPLI